MPDRDKVIRGLECLSRLSQDGTCAGCAYFRPFADDPDTGWCDRTETTKDALVLLREEEPVKPDIGQMVDGVYAVCANCRYSLKLLFDAGGPKIGYLPKFCPECGKAVKWDD